MLLPLSLLLLSPPLLLLPLPPGVLACVMMLQPPASVMVHTLGVCLLYRGRPPTARPYVQGACCMATAGG